jgi:hypothetical protein
MVKIKLGEAEYSLTFNMGFLKMLYKYYNIDPLNMGVLTGAQYFDLATAVIYCGIAATNKKAGKEAPDKEQIEALIDEIHPTEITSITNEMFLWMQTPPETLGADKKEAVNTDTFPLG